MTSSATLKQLLLVVHRCRICWPLYEQSFMVRRQAWAQVLSMDLLFRAFLTFVWAQSTTAPLIQMWLQ